MRPSFDPYAILSVHKNAKSEEIREAYHSLVLANHPDKVGRHDPALQNQGIEKIKLIIRAYKILTDKDERQKWEKESTDFQNANSTHYPQITTTSERFSVRYKKYFELMETVFQKSPRERLTKTDLQEAFSELDDLSKHESFGREYYRRLYISKDDGVEYYDIYQFIAHLEKGQTQALSLDVDFFDDELSPEKAIDLLLGFLHGEYYGENLQSIKNYFQTECEKLYQLENPLLIFYEAIATIFNATSIEKDYQKLLNALEDLYAFTDQKNDDEKMPIVKLMSDRHFRFFVANAHRSFWRGDQPVVNESLATNIKTEYFHTRVSRPVDESESDSDSDSDIGAEVSRRIIRQSVFYTEYQTLNAFSKETNSDNIYDCAYILIDLSECVKDYHLNSLIWAGLCFQYAAQKETVPSKAMAAEHMALTLYQKAMDYAYRNMPTLALYTATHIAKYVSELMYKQTTLTAKDLALSLTQPGDFKLTVYHGSVVNTIKGAIKKSLYLLDIFPVYINPQSSIDVNIRALYQRDLTYLLLHSLLTQSEPVVHHDYTKLIYHTYESLIHKPCDTKKEREERWVQYIQIKSRTIELLLERDDCNPDDMAELIDQPYSHMQRDAGGWFVMNRELNFPDAAQIKIYKSFDGYEIDKATGKINFLLKEWQEGDPRSLRLFTEFDVAQMLNLGIDGGMVSLDQVDPQLRYHPMQMVRFEPNHLKGTGYLKTLLMTDYLLKAFTVGHEVSANIPYLTRKIDTLLSSLPAHLRKMLTICGESEKKNCHRFWITTEEIEREESITTQQIKVYYGDAKVIVRKHLMQYNHYGDLEDTAVDNEHDSPEARFVSAFTQHYDEISEYFPEFRRLKELVKIAGAISELKAKNKLSYKSNVIESTDAYTAQFKKYHEEFTMCYKKESSRIKGAHALSDTAWWDATLEEYIAEKRATLEKEIFADYPKFSYQLNDPEIVDAYNKRYRKEYDRLYLEGMDVAYEAFEDDNDLVFACDGRQHWRKLKADLAKIKTQISVGITQHLTNSLTQQSVLAEYNKRAAVEYQKQRKDVNNSSICIKVREALGETAYSACIDEFMIGNCLPLARAIAAHVLEKLKVTYRAVFAEYYNNFSKLKLILDDVVYRQVIEEYLSGRVEPLAHAFAKHITEREKKERGEPILSSRSVRVPTCFPIMEGGRSYGGALAYPKFCQKITGSNFSFSTPSFTQHQVSRDTRSLTARYQEASRNSSASFTRDPFASFRAQQNTRFAKPVHQEPFKGFSQAAKSSAVVPTAKPATKKTSQPAPASTAHQNQKQGAAQHHDDHQVANVAHNTAHTLGVISHTARRAGIHLPHSFHALEAAAEMSAAVLHETSGQRDNPNVVFENAACGTLTGATKVAANAAVSYAGGKLIGGGVVVVGSFFRRAIPSAATGIVAQDVTEVVTAPVVNAVNRGCHVTFFVAGQMPEEVSRAMADGQLSANSQH
ncbi:MAG: J domain-containing protein [Coxiellaceae bacterium]|nr:J domain-containing protein [Coxiellaceae bacterium]